MARPRSCHCGKCKRCRDADRKKAAYDAMTPAERRAWIASKDRARLYLTRKKSQRRHAARNPQKVAARKAVANAIASGKIAKGPCEQAGDDCHGRIEAHHDDYSKPLEVRFFCTEHHPRDDRRSTISTP